MRNACSPPGKPGRKGADDGLVLVLAPNNKQRKTRLQVGYGLEGAIPDATARRILGEQVRPALDQGGATAAATAAAQAIQKTLTAAGVTPDHSGRKEAEVPAAEIKLFALAFIYFILMFIAIGVFSKRPRRATAAAVCVVLAALAAAAYVWAAGPHPVRMAAGVWLVVLLALAVSFFRYPPPVEVPPRAGTSRKPVAKTDWKPRVPYVGWCGWRWRR